jgi:hypothetical protein
MERLTSRGFGYVSSTNRPAMTTPRSERQDPGRIGVAHRQRSAAAAGPRSLFLLLLFVATPTAIADTPDDIVREVARCAEVGGAEERLRCFEAVAARAKTMLASPLAPAETAQRSPQESFGLSRPAPPATRPEEFGKPMPRPEELQSITAMATEFARTARGKALFVLDNGQVWRQLDSDGSEVTLVPPRPFKVTIERGAFGAYNLTMEGRNALIKVMRLR